MATCQGWWRRVCLAGLPPGSLPLQIACLFPHHPPLYRKLACLQAMNMPINPLFEQYDLLRIGLPGVANTEKGVGGFAIIHISLDLCLLLDLFSLPLCFYLCPFASLIHLPPEVGGTSWLFVPIAQAAMMWREILISELSIWVLQESSGLEDLFPLLGIKELKILAWKWNLKWPGGQFVAYAQA